LPYGVTPSSARTCTLGQGCANMLRVEEQSQSIFANVRALVFCLRWLAYFDVRLGN
jgi:hypothetical protein